MFTFKFVSPQQYSVDFNDNEYGKIIFKYGAYKFYPSIGTNFTTKDLKSIINFIEELNKELS